MDIPRQTAVRQRRRFKYLVHIIIGVGTLVLITFGVSRLKPAAPGVEQSAVLIDTVKRGLMLREVRGTGTLVAADIRVIAASTEGRVERILMQPGAEVSPGTVILELVNPQLEQEAMDAEYQLRAGEADLNNLRVRMESDRMTQQAATASVHSDYQQAQLQTETEEALAKEGLIPALTLKLSRVKTAELANRYKIEQRRVEVNTRSAQAQIASQQARLQQLRALLALKRSQAQALHVRAGTAGVIQQMQVEIGQQVTPGTNLARVANPSSLKAELRIPETQAKDIQLGQAANIDTRNGIIPGRVMRIDPAVQQGTVTVDVSLDGGLPQGARPDLSVDGTIELERLNDVIYIARPAFGQGQSVVTLFKVEAGGASAVRVQVRLGRTSVNTVEVLEGLNVGDQVILSDTSQWDAFDRIVLN